jgi:hypothetical protein
LASNKLLITVTYSVRKLLLTKKLKKNMKSLKKNYKLNDVLLAVLFIVVFTTVAFSFTNSVIGASVVCLLLSVASFAPYKLPKGAMFDMVFRPPIQAK